MTWDQGTSDNGGLGLTPLRQYNFPENLTKMTEEIKVLLRIGFPNS